METFGYSDDIELVKLNLIEKARILHIMGYNIDSSGFVTREGNIHKDRYTHDPVRFKDCDICPGRDGEPLVFNDGIFELICYLEEIED